MIPFSRRLSWSVVLVLAAGSAAVVLAQEKNDAPNGSLAALTAEIRQLRVAVEESTRSQTQTQALGVYLSVQQSRILQAATRLESARKELDAVSLRSREIASQLENFQGEILRVTEPQRRAQLEDANQQLKFEQRHVVEQEQQARAREAELSQALQVEESRWTDLITRLEQLIRR
jgi:hypothetical protein